MSENDHIEKTVITKFVPKEPTNAGDDALVQIYPPGPNLGKKWKLCGKLSIGRGNTCDIVIENNSVSRLHTTIETTTEGQQLVDLTSTNGSFVNNIRLTSKLLEPGDQIKIGDTIFKYLTGKDIENTYHEEIYKMTIVDGLTNIYNKRYFMDEIQRETARSCRYNRPLSLIMFDIDHFKLINDDFGHLAGDMILQEMTAAISSRIRKGEMFSRYGGEEFSILLPETLIDGAVQFAELIRHIVRETLFVFGDATIPVSISLGVATIQNEDVNEIEFIARADKKLYEAKETGRNKVCH